jgi:hypothetical protein
VALLPFGDQVAAIKASACLVAVFGVVLRSRHEILATTAHQHVEPAPERRFDDWRAMSMQPAVLAACGISASPSQLRSAEWAMVAPGVAWVRRVVVTTPA